jgi:hypothetical protein
MRSSLKSGFKGLAGGESVADKKLRLCALVDKKVVCDGLCKVVSDDGVPHLCRRFVKTLGRIYDEAFDLLVNC